MTEKRKHRFELWGAESGNLYCSMLDPETATTFPEDWDMLDTAYELNEMFDKTVRFNREFLNITESLRVEYVPDPVVLRLVK